MERHATAGKKWRWSDADDPPSFFKILFQKSFEKLKIPKDFTIYLREETSREATVINPVGAIWQVRICEDEHGLHFGEGWEDVVMDNDIQEGYFLVIFYKGDMVFTFTAYDFTACEINSYAAIGSSMDQKVMKKKMTMKYGSSVGVNEKSKKRTMKHFCAMKPHIFEAVIHYTDLQWKQLNIPMAFKDVNGLYGNRDMTLVDPQRRSWPVRLRLCNQQGLSNYRAVFGVGWRTFAENNNLWLGDRCIFELVSKEKGVFNVQIVRKSDTSARFQDI